MTRGLRRNAPGLAVVIAASLATGASAGVILWDDSHDTNGDELDGLFTGFAAAIRGAGHTISELDGVPGAITPEALEGVDGFMIMDAEAPLLASEIATLQAFVARGGGLFVSADTGFDFASQNTLLAPWGLSFGTDAMFPDGTVISNLVNHKVVDEIGSFGIDLGFEVETSGSAIDLVLGGDFHTLGVAGNGDKVVALGDTTVFSDFGDFNINSLDNAALAVNIANWITTPAPSGLGLLMLVGVAGRGNRRRRV